MSTPAKLHLILCWHMHQPDYRNRVTGEFELPWTYLHAIKDYTDMAHHLEQHPGARAVLNFVPSLIDQLVDYGQQFASGEMRDPLLAMLALPDMDKLTLEQRRSLLDSCFRSNHNNMIAPFPAYSRLHQMFMMLDTVNELQLSYLSPQYLADLLVWYHLTWMGESVRRSEELVSQLMAKECQFTYAERKQLFELIGRLIVGIIPRYRKLQDNGQIEVSTTPYYHPILPLLIDFDSAREAMPQAELPKTPRYPGGRERAGVHVEKALENYRQHFGGKPHGMWPGEGGISLPAAGVLAAHGCEWTASGETVLFNSLRRIHGDGMPERVDYLYRPYRCLTENGEILCFFRDDRLSDKIGFEYTKWHGRDAVNDFIRSLEEIRHHSNHEEEPVVSVILDGENAWEYYPYNGYYFLSELYEALEHHPYIRTATFAECADKLGAAPKGAREKGRIALEPGSLPAMVAGSWVYGTFSTWIGMADKNHAWDLLCAAKTSYDRVINSGRLNEEEQRRAEQQLGICEGSDWFWWFGDYNPGVSVQSFDRLYRLNLANLYQLLNLPVPVEVQHPISVGQGGDVAMGGTMRRGTE
ncbi:MAG: glycoside hydrolase [Sideroxydans sp.]|nr:glycoside hydrolase [Sideroxydans sp.]